MLELWTNRLSADLNKPDDLVYIFILSCDQLVETSSLAMKSQPIFFVVVAHIAKQVKL